MRIAVVLAALALASPAAAAKTPLPGLRTPSGNISCFSIPGRAPSLHCSIKQASYSAKLVAYCGQASIGVDWAGFSLGPTHRGVRSSAPAASSTARTRSVPSTGRSRTARRGSSA